MHIRKIRIIYLKEMRETLRDRRTIISSILIPILLFPVLMYGIGTVMKIEREKTKAEVPKITIIGESFAPSFVSALRRGDSFEIVPARDFRTAVAHKEINAALEFPVDFEKKLRLDSTTEAIIYFDAAESRSSLARDKLKSRLAEYQDSLVTKRLLHRNIDRSVLHPIIINENNLASKQKMSGFMLGMFLPYMIVILAMIGAMYPAIDLTAGEKERGTLETILVTPVSRLDIATGKFLAVLTASCITVILAITSMSLSTLWGFTQLGGTASPQVPMAIRPFSILLVFLLMVPLAAIFSSALLSVCLLAKSYKEAQSYVSPLMFLVILPAMVSFIPEIELSWGWAFVPIVNVSLAAREVLVGTFRWGFISLIFLSTFIYASFSIFVTKKLFEKEEVLFRS
jgi:sodium transport system permease protein